jgi:hypothetical protein
MKKKAPKSEYEALLQKSRLFSKKLMEFAFRELNDASVRIDESDDPEEFKLTLTSSKKDSKIRILVEYIYDNNSFSVEITDFSDGNFFNFAVASRAKSEYEELIPASLKKILRDKYLKTRPEIN